MPTSVALSPHFEAFIQEQVKSGRYNNASEVGGNRGRSDISTLINAHAREKLR